MEACWASAARHAEHASLSGTFPLLVSHPQGFRGRRRHRPTLPPPSLSTSPTFAPSLSIWAKPGALGTWSAMSSPQSTAHATGGRKVRAQPAGNAAMRPLTFVYAGRPAPSPASSPEVSRERAWRRTRAVPAARPNLQISDQGERLGRSPSARSRRLRHRRRPRDRGSSLAPVLSKLWSGCLTCDGF